MFYIWITMQCYFAFLSIDMFVFFTRYSLRYSICLWSCRYFIHKIVIVLSKLIWHSLSLRNYLLILPRWIRAIILWAKPFDCEKLNKIDFKLFSSWFRHLCISLSSNLADHRDVLSPDLSRSSTSRSDLLKLPKLSAELRFIVLRFSNLNLACKRR